MASKFLSNLFNREKAPVLTGGVSYDMEDLMNSDLSKQEKADIIQGHYQEEMKRLDKELRDYKAKQYAGAALQIGSAAIPIGAGLRLGGGLIKALTPRLGAKIAQEVGTGLVGGAISGLVEGFGRGMVEDENPFKTAINDALIGGVTGGAGGYGLGKLGQNMARREILNAKPLFPWNNKPGSVFDSWRNQKLEQYFNDYVNGLSNTGALGKITPLGNAMADFRGIRQGVGRGNSETAYNFIGENAFNAPKGKLMQAQQMQNYGEDANYIFDETGWFKGVDGKWRYEIPDGEIVQNPKLTKGFDDDIGTYYTTTIGELYDNPELYRNYPQLKDRSVVIQDMPKGTTGSSWGDSIALNRDLYSIDNPEYLRKVRALESNPEYLNFKNYENDVFNKLDNLELPKQLNEHQNLMNELDARTTDFYNNNPVGKEYSQLMWHTPKSERKIQGFGDNAKKTLIHELQHQIQDIEGFAKGGNTHNPNYHNLAGEVEARLAAARANLTPEQRSIYFPANDNLSMYAYDVLPERQIVEFNNNNPMSSFQKQLFNYNAKTGSNISGTMEMWQTKNIPTFQLPKEEYAIVRKVMDSLEYPPEYRNKPFFKLPLSNGYIYSIENNGYGNFRVLGKEQINAKIYD